MKSPSVPVIDIAASSAAAAIREACRDSGFFYVVGHGVDSALLKRLERLSREFFAKPSSEKDYLINKVSKVFPELRRDVL